MVNDASDRATTSERTEPDGMLAAGEAARRLGDWGFLAHPDLPDAPGPAYLVVAIRPNPTLRHFDPESIQYWRSVSGRGTAAFVDRTTPTPLDHSFSWGEIRISDRLHESNEYVTFGGRLVAERVGDATIAVFESPAPLLRRGGHSQLADQAAADVSAFFARLVNALGPPERPADQPGVMLEARLAAAPPRVLYAAFLEDAAGRLRGSPTLRSARPEFAVLVGGERTGLARREPLVIADGHDLLVAAGLV